MALSAMPRMAAICEPTKRQERLREKNRRWNGQKRRGILATAPILITQSHRGLACDPTKQKRKELVTTPAVATPEKIWFQEPMSWRTCAFIVIAFMRARTEDEISRTVGESQPRLRF
jgi:hypothetical protein